MKVKFNGLVEQKVRGCGGCGSRTSEKRFVRTKEFFMPSGQTLFFRAGNTVEVSESDGEFLLETGGFERV